MSRNLKRIRALLNLSTEEPLREPREIPERLPISPITVGRKSDLDDIISNISKSNDINPGIVEKAANNVIKMGELPNQELILKEIDRLVN